MKKTVQQLAAWLNIENQSFGDVVVTGVSIDTRTIEQGDLFIPFRGEQTNGHRFVEKAFEQGAVASLWLKDEPNPPANVPLIFVDDAEEALQQMARAYRAEHNATFIGITGSNGKTSSKDILAGALAPFYKVQKTIGNFNNQLGLPITILRLDEDTEIAVLEMGMSGFGEIEFLTKLARPHLAVITNIGEAHMQDLGSRAGIAKAKFEIVDGLLPGGKLFYDGDEPLLAELVASASRDDIEYVSFGFDGAHAQTASNITTVDNGSQFEASGVVNGEYFISVLGKHQVKNTLSTMLIANHLRLTDEQIRASLAQVVLTDMRMQLIDTAHTLFINDAYNAAPTSMKAAIDFMKTTTLRDEKWLVLGDMLELGDDELTFHASIAESIEADKVAGVCLYGPRMKALYDALLPTLGERVLHSEDVAPMIERIREQAGKNSVVLVKASRGMKLERVIEAFQ
ncbi:UDP-N-acetylmuramoyl-tripeptide--D-alanyl-D-alanine ligase [Caryophanon latum]|uniref:UDP-N-acetylmuramoyl-tripeptide--D-alanyl-D-alanine ligase n=1 Tax=Caryophanon latum TaxID=33977 RepID=A0A1C0Z4P5_9BACL|nr:UDP-N-acetylmuramoyl-tripeptide--D-alanyl-D-alanine ligase [Caryophanon latum]OCS94412.1 UDP-N-acetylmuramoylalanyl-D-glutamate--2,6-diaminopimelate ligase [Caryophanon latum]